MEQWLRLLSVVQAGEKFFSPNTARSSSNTLAFIWLNSLECYVSNAGEGWRSRLLALSFCCQMWRDRKSIVGRCARMICRAIGHRTTLFSHSHCRVCKKGRYLVLPSTFARGTGCKLLLSFCGGWSMSHSLEAAQLTYSTTNIRNDGQMLNLTYLRTNVGLWRNV